MTMSKWKAECQKQVIKHTKGDYVFALVVCVVFSVMIIVVGVLV